MTDNKAEIFSRQDRDLLIVLNTKFDNMSQDVKLMGDGMIARIHDAEVRVLAIEKIISEVRPIETYTRFLKVEEEYKRTKWLMWFLGGAAIIISWTTGFLNQILTLFNRG